MEKKCLHGLNMENGHTEWVSCLELLQLYKVSYASQNMYTQSKNLIFAGQTDLFLPLTCSASSVAKVIGIGVHIYIFVDKKIELYFRDRLTFSNIRGRTFRQICSTIAFSRTIISLLSNW